jgi:hypothetical protein
VTSPLRLTFEVSCSAEHAFAMWTSRIGTWWPPDHTVTGDPDLLVVLESGVGGRIYERTAAGVEHDWGVVTVWDPPLRLAYLWHLGRDRNEATDVDIRFLDCGPGKTRVEVEHTGWERLADRADAWRDLNQNGWETLLPHFEAATTTGER